MSEEKKDEVQAEGFGIYVKLVDNLTKYDIQIKVREYPNLSLAIEANETDKPANFPLPWVSDVTNEGKCISIKIPELSINILLCDDHSSGAYYNKKGQWNTQADKVAGNAYSHGDYRLIIKENGSLKMEKFQ